MNIDSDVRSIFSSSDDDSHYSDSSSSVKVKKENDIRKPQDLNIQQRRQQKRSAMTYTTSSKHALSSDSDKPSSKQSLLSTSSNFSSKGRRKIIPDSRDLMNSMMKVQMMRRVVLIALKEYLMRKRHLMSMEALLRSLLGVRKPDLMSTPHPMKTRIIKEEQNEFKYYRRGEV